MSDHVKRGDTKLVHMRVSADLTGSTLTKVSARKSGIVYDLLPTTSILNPTNGLIQHELSGLLEAGEYELEVEFEDQFGRIHTAPSHGYAWLRVEPDLA
jgi:hypothetical protein